MSDIHNMRIRDGVDNTLIVEVNTLKELRTFDPTLLTVQASALTKLTDIETAIQAVETNQTDKTQFSKITDGTNDLVINADGSINVSPSDYYLEAARGNISGVSMIAFSSRSTEITNTGFSDVWALPGNLVFPTGAESWEVVSDNANDTAAGSGLQTVLITSLDTDFVEQSQIVTMNGTTAVALTGTHYRAVRMVGLTFGGVGPLGVTTGKITLQVSGGGAVRDAIPADGTLCTNSHYTVPAGKSAFFTQSQVYTQKNEDVEIRLRFTQGETGPYLFGGSVPFYQGSSVAPFRTGLLLPEKSDVFYQAKAQTQRLPFRLLLSLK